MERVPGLTFLCFYWSALFLIFAPGKVQRLRRRHAWHAARCRTSAKSRTKNFHMEHIDKLLIDFLRSVAGVSDDILGWVYPLTAAFAVALLSYACTALFRFVVMPAVQKLTEKTKATWDDYLFNRRVMRAFRRLIPPVIWYATLPLVFTHSPGLLSLLLKVCSIYLVIVSLLFISQFLHSLYDISAEHQKAAQPSAERRLPDVQPVGVRRGMHPRRKHRHRQERHNRACGLRRFGRRAHAHLQGLHTRTGGRRALSANDMLRPGDWITMQKYGANGYVLEVSLTTVKVQNFDKTITTIPPYALVSDSFQNWRGMRESGGRRLKLSVNIDANTVRFCSPDEPVVVRGKGLCARVALCRCRLSRGQHAGVPRLHVRLHEEPSRCAGRHDGDGAHAPAYARRAAPRACIASARL